MGSIRQPRQQEEDPNDGGAELGRAGLLGVVTCSMTITLAVREPPPGLDKNAYILAVAGAFFAGVAGVVAAVCLPNNPRVRRAAGRKLIMHASAEALAVAVGLSAASLLW
ncbi:uncharacterized protein C2845_PM08G05410 [Panicum miliaceum]|uniref:Uncharacterized protein n=1 Tax=Panicum miliaceum TaxID=4540 RepID=A0A3L6R2R7_PANMI|nr:uncharacterized protein C2845_PM08G05410 [Panicum miliaceum]